MMYYAALAIQAEQEALLRNREQERLLIKTFSKNDTYYIANVTQQIQVELNNQEGLTT